MAKIPYTDTRGVKYWYDTETKKFERMGSSPPATPRPPPPPARPNQPEKPEAPKPDRPRRPRPDSSAAADRRLAANARYEAQRAAQLAAERAKLQARLRERIERTTARRTEKLERVQAQRRAVEARLALLNQQLMAASKTNNPAAIAGLKTQIDVQKTILAKVSSQGDTVERQSVAAAAAAVLANRAARSRVEANNPPVEGETRQERAARLKRIARRTPRVRNVKEPQLIESKFKRGEAGYGRDLDRALAVEVAIQKNDPNVFNPKRFTDLGNEIILHEEAVANDVDAISKRATKLATSIQRDIKRKKVSAGTLKRYEQLQKLTSPENLKGLRRTHKLTFGSHVTTVGGKFDPKRSVIGLGEKFADGAETVYAEKIKQIESGLSSALTGKSLTPVLGAAITKFRGDVVVATADATRHDVTDPDGTVRRQTRAERLYEMAKNGEIRRQAEEEAGAAFMADFKEEAAKNANDPVLRFLYPKLLSVGIKGSEDYTDDAFGMAKLRRAVPESAVLAYDQWIIDNPKDARSDGFWAGIYDSDNYRRDENGEYFIAPDGSVLRPGDDYEGVVPLWGAVPATKVGKLAIPSLRTGVAAGGDPFEHARIRADFDKRESLLRKFEEKMWAAVGQEDPGFFGRLMNGSVGMVLNGFDAAQSAAGLGLRETIQKELYLSNEKVEIPKALQPYVGTRAELEEHEDIPGQRILQEILGAPRDIATDIVGATVGHVIGRDASKATVDMVNTILQSTMLLPFNLVVIGSEVGKEVLSGEDALRHISQYDDKGIGYSAVSLAHAINAGLTVTEEDSPEGKQTRYDFALTFNGEPIIFSWVAGDGPETRIKQSGQRVHKAFHDPHGSVEIGMEVLSAEGGIFTGGNVGTALNFVFLMVADLTNYIPILAIARRSLAAVRLGVGAAKVPASSPLAKMAAIAAGFRDGALTNPRKAGALAEMMTDFTTGAGMSVDDSITLWNHVLFGLDEGKRLPEAVESAFTKMGLVNTGLDSRQIYTIAERHVRTALQNRGLIVHTQRDLAKAAIAKNQALYGGAYQKTVRAQRALMEQERIANQVRRELRPIQQQIAQEEAARAALAAPGRKVMSITPGTPGKATRVRRRVAAAAPSGAPPVPKRKVYLGKKPKPLAPPSPPQRVGVWRWRLAPQQPQPTGVPLLTARAAHGPAGLTYPPPQRSYTAIRPSERIVDAQPTAGQEVRDIDAILSSGRDRTGVPLSENKRRALQTRRDSLMREINKGDPQASKQARATTRSINQRTGRSLAEADAIRMRNINAQDALIKSLQRELVEQRRLRGIIAKQAAQDSPTVKKALAQADRAIDNIEQQIRAAADYMARLARAPQATLAAGTRTPPPPKRVVKAAKAKKQGRYEEVFGDLGPVESGSPTKEVAAIEEVAARELRMRAVSGYQPVGVISRIMSGEGIYFIPGNPAATSDWTQNLLARIADSSLSWDERAAAYIRLYDHAAITNAAMARTGGRDLSRVLTGEYDRSLRGVLTPEKRALDNNISSEMGAAIEQSRVGSVPRHLAIVTDEAQQLRIVKNKKGDREAGLGLLDESSVGFGEDALEDVRVVGDVGEQLDPYVKAGRLYEAYGSFRPFTSHVESFIESDGLRALCRQVLDPNYQASLTRHGLNKLLESLYINRAGKYLKRLDDSAAKLHKEYAEAKRFRDAVARRLKEAEAKVAAREKAGVKLTFVDDGKDVPTPARVESLTDELAEANKRLALAERDTNEALAKLSEEAERLMSGRVVAPRVALKEYVDSVQPLFDLLNRMVRRADIPERQMVYLHNAMVRRVFEIADDGALIIRKSDDLAITWLLMESRLGLSHSLPASVIDSVAWDMFTSKGILPSEALSMFNGTYTMRVSPRFSHWKPNLRRLWDEPFVGEGGVRLSYFKERAVEMGRAPGRKIAHIYRSRMFRVNQAVKSLKTKDLDIVAYARSVTDLIDNQIARWGTVHGTGEGGALRAATLEEVAHGFFSSTLKRSQTRMRRVQLGQAGPGRLGHSVVVDEAVDAVADARLKAVFERYMDEVRPGWTPEFAYGTGVPAPSGFNPAVTPWEQFIAHVSLTNHQWDDVLKNGVTEGSYWPSYSRQGTGKNIRPGLDPAIRTALEKAYHYGDTVSVNGKSVRVITSQNPLEATSLFLQQMQFHEIGTNFRLSLQYLDEMTAFSKMPQYNSNLGEQAADLLRIIHKNDLADVQQRLVHVAGIAGKEMDAKILFNRFLRHDTALGGNPTKTGLWLRLTKSDPDEVYRAGRIRANALDENEYLDADELERIDWMDEEQVAIYKDKMANTPVRSQVIDSHRGDAEAAEKAGMAALEAQEIAQAAGKASEWTQFGTPDEILNLRQRLAFEDDVEVAIRQTLDDARKNGVIEAERRYQAAKRLDRKPNYPNGKPMRHAPKYSPEFKRFVDDMGRLFYIATKQYELGIWDRMVELSKYMNEVMDELAKEGAVVAELRMQLVKQMPIGATEDVPRVTPRAGDVIAERRYRAKEQGLADAVDTTAKPVAEAPVGAPPKPEAPPAWRSKGEWVWVDETPPVAGAPPPGPVKRPLSGRRPRARGQWEWKTVHGMPTAPTYRVVSLGPDPAAQAAAAQAAMANIMGLSEEDMLRLIIQRNQAALKGGRVTATEASVLRTQIRNSRHTIKYIERLKANGMYGGTPHERWMHAHSAVKALGNTMDGIIPPRSYAYYGPTEAALNTEAGRGINVTLKRTFFNPQAGGLPPSAANTLAPADYELLDELVSIEIRKVQGKRTSPVGLKSLPDELDPDITVVPTKSDDLLLRDARERGFAAFYRKTGRVPPSHEVYERVRTIMQPYYIKRNNGRGLLKKAQQIQGKYGGDAREIFLNLRKRRADKNARENVAWEMVKHPHLTMDEAAARVTATWFDDGTLRKPGLEMTEFDEQVLKNFFTHFTGENFDDPVGLARALQANGTLPPTDKRWRFRAHQESIGSWSPRAVDDVVLKGAWSYDDQQAWWDLYYGTRPAWLTDPRVETGEIFLTHRAYIDGMTENGNFTDYVVRQAIEGTNERATLEDLAFGRKGPNGEFIIKPQQDTEMQRIWMVETYGSRVGVKHADGSVTLHSAPWLMNESEYRAFRASQVLDNAQGLIPPEIYTKVDDVIQQHTDRWVDYYMEPTRYGGTLEVNPDVVHRITHELVREIMATQPWRGVMRPDQMLRGWQKLWTALVIASPAFWVSNVVDIVLRGGIFKTSLKETRHLSAYADNLIPTPQSINRGHEAGYIYDMSSRSFVERISSATSYGKADRIGATFDLLTSTVARKLIVPVEAKVKHHFMRALATEYRYGVWKGNIIERVLGGKATNMSAYDSLIARGATPEQADMLIKLQVQRDIDRMFPTLENAGLGERMLNSFLPFLSYNAKNKIIWVSWALDHPLYVRMMNEARQVIVDNNVKEWEERHPDIPIMPKNLTHQIHVVDDMYFDISNVIDVARGMQPLVNPGGIHGDVGGLIQNLFRPLPSQRASWDAFLYGFGIGGRQAYEKVLDENGMWTGEHKLVTLPPLTPWGGTLDPIADLLFPVPFLQLIRDSVTDGKLTSAQEVRILGKLLFFGGLSEPSDYFMLNQKYFALKEASDEVARAWLATEEGQRLKEYWGQSGPLEGNLNKAAFLFFNKDGSPREPSLEELRKSWLSQQPPEWRDKFFKAQDERQMFSEQFDILLDRLDPEDAKGRDDLWGFRRTWMMDWYDRNPGLAFYEGMIQDKDAMHQNWVLEGMAAGFYARFGSAQEPEDAKEADAWRKEREEYLKANPELREYLWQEASQVRRADMRVTESYKEFFRQDMMDDNLREAIEALEWKNGPEAIAAAKDFAGLAFDRSMTFVDPESPTGFGFRPSLIIKKIRSGDPKALYAPRMAALYRETKNDVYEWWKRLDKTPDLKQMYFDKNPEKRATWQQDGKYYAFWGRFGRLADKGRWDEAWDSWDNAPNWIRDRMRENNPQKFRSLERSSRYSSYMGIWVGYMKAGNYRQGMAYFYSMPKWVREQYYANNPGKRYSSGQSAAYVGMLDRMFGFIDNGDWDAAEKVWRAAPSWMRDRYYANNPDSKLFRGGYSGGSSSGSKRPAISDAQFKQYMGFMKVWIGLQRDGKDKQADNYFRSMPKWAQEFYIAGHQDKALLRESLRMQTLLAEYFMADPLEQKAMRRNNPRLMKWLQENDTKSARQNAILFAYSKLPDDPWLQRVYREKYPEIFSAEARGKKTEEQVMEILLEHPKLVPGFMKWYEDIHKTLEEALQNALPRPRPLEVVRAEQPSSGREGVGLSAEEVASRAERYLFGMRQLPLNVRQPRLE